MRTTLTRLQIEKYTKKFLAKKNTNFKRMLTNKDRTYFVNGEKKLSVYTYLTEFTERACDLEEDFNKSHEEDYDKTLKRLESLDYEYVNHIFTYEQGNITDYILSGTMLYRDGTSYFILNVYYMGADFRSRGAWSENFFFKIENSDFHFPCPFISSEDYVFDMDCDGWLREEELEEEAI